MTIPAYLRAFLERVYALRFYALLLLALQLYPAVYYYSRGHVLPFPGEVVYQGISLLAWSCWWILLLALIPHRGVRRLLQVLIGLIYAGAMLFECFLVYSYGSLYTDSIALNMMASNPAESKAFVENLNYRVFALPLIVLCVLTLIYVYLERSLSIRLRSARTGLRLIVPLVALASVGLWAVWVLPAQIKIRSYLYMSPLDRFRVGTLVCLHDARELEGYLQRAKSLDIGPVTQEKSLDSVNVVVLIGESMRRDYMHCYGYPLPNTPAQDSLIASGDMVRFTDVIAPAAWTTGSVTACMTLYREDGGGKQWYQYPTLPMVMSRAGYYSYWISNHERQGNAVQPVSTVAGTADSTLYVKTRALGDWNSARDLEILPFLKQGIQLPAGKKALFQVVHLIGSHTPYSARSTSEIASFTTQDLPEHLPNGRPTPREEAKRAVIRDYVNSIRYNDEVVRRIVAHFADKPTILLYFSDHGQALYENPNKPDYYEHEVSQAGLAIPLLVYMSPSLKAQQPEIYDAVVRAKDRRIMNDLLSNSLCGLLGIRMKYYEPEYDFFSDKYREDRPRTVLGYNGKPINF